MSNETSKAMRRRFREHDAGGFPWRDVFRGRMLDVGCGADKLPFDTCIGFDQQDGDANHLSQYFEPASFDVLHGSHVAEHLHDAKASLRDWMTLLKPGGHLIITVPDVGAYENFIYPSRYNPDHKASFSMIYRGSPFPNHYHIPTLMESFNDVAETLLSRYVEVNYNWRRREVDQTWIESDGIEIWNEWVQKLL